jgi:hypothetical protein
MQWAVTIHADLPRPAPLRPQGQPVPRASPIGVAALIVVVGAVLFSLAEHIDFATSRSWSITLAEAGPAAPPIQEHQYLGSVGRLSQSGP